MPYAKNLAWLPGILTFLRSISRSIPLIFAVVPRSVPSRTADKSRRL